MTITLVISWSPETEEARLDRLSKRKLTAMKKRGMYGSGPNVIDGIDALDDMIFLLRAERDKLRSDGVSDNPIDQSVANQLFGVATVKP